MNTDSGEQPETPPTQADPAPPATKQPRDPRRLATPLPLLMLGALGIVFGDIGTSPLYALQTVFSIHHNSVAPTEQDVLGVVSMVFWCLMLIVSIAYLGFILRADNEGEGGILSLAALIKRKLGAGSSRVKVVMVLAIIGAALFYGDSLITPAVSVLSAVEGLHVVSSDLGPWVVPIAVVILTSLFAVQRWGTGSIGRAFGPIMLIWFLVLALLGTPQIFANPTILRALSPTYAVDFAVDRPIIGFIAAGAVVLAVTGVEALYADMGHFGRRPIVIAWLSIIFPALILNYFGQGAMILADPTTIENPFFRLAPGWAQMPLVILATAATIIASQAVISGAFSVSRQATRLSLLPRLKVIQTSRQESGQIYVPAVNAILFLGVLALVLAFRSSQALASAYGLAVTATLLLELSLFLLLALEVWKWRLPWVVLTGLTIGGVEFALFSANVVKIAAGGWLPLAIAAVLVTIMLTWKKGSALMFGRRAEMEGPIEDFVDEIGRAPVLRVPGVAVYPHGNPGTAPLALRSNVECNHVLHEHVVIVTIKNLGVPHVPHDQRVLVSDLGRSDDGIVHILYSIGFNDSQDVPSALRQAVGRTPELDFDPKSAMYVISVFRIEPGSGTGMPRWQKSLFRTLEKASANRTQVLHLPPDRTTVMGETAEL